MKQILLCPHCGFCDHTGMIRFLDLLEEEVKKCPKCYKDARFMTVREKDDPIIIGNLIDCTTGEENFAHLHYRIMDGVFWLEDGPTGYESFYLEHDTVERMSEGGWCACAGTKGRWDTLRISAEEMKRVFDLIARHPER